MINIEKGNIKITVKKVHVEGSGAIILTGPSSCGKGEIANELRRILSIPNDHHLSMGNILRSTINKAKLNHSYKEMLARDYFISYRISIFDKTHNSIELIEKANNHLGELKSFFHNNEEITQLDWLEFCVKNGLLVPDDWTIRIINATFHEMKELRNHIFILDGYPRTIKATEELLKTFSRLTIPIIKVIHLSITKDEMLSRALGRKREDDTIDSLERRYEFYLSNVQPSIDYFKVNLDPSCVALIDAHQPIYKDDKLDVNLSIKKVALSVLQSLGIPSYMLDL